MKDWVGNKKSTFTALGASNHTNYEREMNDYYASEPRIIDELFAVEEFKGTILECACGEGHLSKQMEKLGKTVNSTDLIYRGYGKGGINFLLCDGVQENTHVITNPPYKYALEFIKKAISIIQKGYKVAMFLKLTFLEGQKRHEFFRKFPPKVIYVYSSRRKCALNGKFEATGSSACCYAWFVWEKNYKKDPIIKWII